MATRFYLSTAAAPYTPPTLRGTWADTTLSTNVWELSRTRSGANTAVARAETSASNNFKVLLHRHVSGPLAGGAVTTSNSITHTQARQEDATAANMTVQIAVWVTVGDSDTVRGSLIEPFAGATEFATTMTAFSYTLTMDNAFTIQPGDRLVIELGYNAANTSTTSRTGTVRAGGTAADLATSGTTGVTTNSPWVEFDAGLDSALAAGAAPVSGTAAALLDALSSTAAGVVTSPTSAIRRSFARPRAANF